jgi:hypothetical protein
MRQSVAIRLHVSNVTGYVNPVNCRVDAQVVGYGTVEHYIGAGKTHHVSDKCDRVNALDDYCWGFTKSRVLL